MGIQPQAGTDIAPGQRYGAVKDFPFPAGDDTMKSVLTGCPFGTFVPKAGADGEKLTGGLFVGIFDKLKGKKQKPEYQTAAFQSLGDIYPNLAKVLVETIPCEWNNIYYLGEVEREKKSWSSAFYFVDKDGHIVDGMDIPSLYNVSKEVFSNQLNKMNELLLAIYKCFESTGQQLWEQVRFSIDSAGKFQVDSRYDIMNADDGGQILREIIWAYETFKYKPKEGTYCRRLLDKWLSQQQQK